MSESRSDGRPRAGGEWMGGDTAEAFPARLEIDGDRLLVLAPDTGRILAEWPIASVSIDTLHEGGPAHLETSGEPDRLATTSSPPFLAELRARGARSSGLPTGRRAVWIALGCSLSVAAIFAGLYAGAPWISRRVARHVPLELERRLQPRVTRFFESQTCSTEEASAALEALSRRLDPDRRVPAHVRVVNIAVPNAFAMPGGDVLLTRGLVEQATTADEVAGVLAHELSHVLHRHVLAGLIENAFLSAVWAVTIGDYSGLLVVDPQTVQRLATLRHSRAAEAEADESAMRLLAAARISSAGLAAFFERNRATADADLSFLSTHPETDARIRGLRRGAVSGGPPVLDAEAFRALQRACKGREDVHSLKDLFR